MEVAVDRVDAALEEELGHRLAGLSESIWGDAEILWDVGTTILLVETGARDSAIEFLLATDRLATLVDCDDNLINKGKLNADICVKQLLTWLRRLQRKIERHSLTLVNAAGFLYGLSSQEEHSLVFFLKCWPAELASDDRDRIHVAFGLDHDAVVLDRGVLVDGERACHFFL